MDLEKQLTDLDLQIARLKIAFDRFFAGVEKLPPERERDRLAALIRQLNDTSMPNSAQRFYFQTLMSRFHSYTELWNRLLRAREEGLALAAGGAPIHRVPTPAHPLDAGASARRDPMALRFGPPGADSDMKEFFSSFVDLRKQTGEPVDRLSLPQFQKLIQGQYQSLTQKGNAANIEFRLAIKDGKVQITAKPIAGK